MKKKPIKFTALMLIVVMVVAITGCGKSVDPNAELANVNDAVITQGQLDSFSVLYMYMLGYDPSELTSEQKQSLLEDMVDTEVISQYYDTLDESIYDDSYDSNVESFIASAHESEEDFLQQYDITDEALAYFYKCQYITQAFFTEIQAENSDTDMYAQAQEYYSDHLDDYTVDDEVRASVILVETEESAQKVYTQLQAGADFAELAKSESIESNSAENGGDLGYFTKEQMSDEYSDKVFALQTGEITEPVKTDDGYAIIKITDRNETGYRPLEEVLQDIYYTIYNGLYSARVEALKVGMTIDIGEAS